MTNTEKIFSGKSVNWTEQPPDQDTIAQAKLLHGALEQLMMRAAYVEREQVHGDPDRRHPLLYDSVREITRMHYRLSEFLDQNGESVLKSVTQLDDWDNEYWQRYWDARPPIGAAP